MLVVPKDQVAEVVKWKGMMSPGYPGWVIKLMVERKLYEEDVKGRPQAYLVQSDGRIKGINYNEYIIKHPNGNIARLPAWLFNADYEVLVDMNPEDPHNL